MRWLKRVVWVLFFLWLLIAFIPKTNLYYFAEEFLQTHKIVFNAEKTSDFLGIFSIKDAQVYYDGLHVGDVKSASLLPFVLYNNISLKQASFVDNMKQFVPKNINSLQIHHTLFYPIEAFIFGDGDFGELQGSVNFYTKKLTLTLTPAKNFAKNYPAIASEFKQKEGKYIYETNF